MDLGDLLLKLALVATIASGALYWASLRGRRTPAAADWLVGVQAFALAAAIGRLWMLFVAHRFEYDYVAQYSSRSLSPALSFAASWAGQEGSFLLWAALVSVLALALMRQPGGLARPALFFVNLSQVFLLILILLRSPFHQSGAMPADGRGLNPLLEDPWMVAHPPVLFLGYAAMAIPFALAAAALALRQARPSLLDR